MNDIEQLNRGLKKLGPDFAYRICEVCKGHGSYEQMYTAGCGGGYYRSMGPCDYCNKSGMVTVNGSGAASSSVVAQVMKAGE